MFSVKLIGCYLQQQNADLAPAPIKTRGRYAGAFGNLGHRERVWLFFRQQCGGGFKRRSLIACRATTWTSLLHGSILTQNN
jgi:hypothetical protein